MNSCRKKRQTSNGSRCHKHSGAKYKKVVAFCFRNTTLCGALCEVVCVCVRVFVESSSAGCCHSVIIYLLAKLHYKPARVCRATGDLFGVGKLNLQFFSLDRSCRTTEGGARREGSGKDKQQGNFSQYQIGLLVRQLSVSFL